MLRIHNLQDPEVLNDARYQQPNIDLDLLDRFAAAEPQQPRASSATAASDCQQWINAPNTFVELEKMYVDLGLKRKDPNKIPRLHCFVPADIISTKSSKEIYKYVLANSFHPSVLYYAANYALKAALREDTQTGHMIFAWAGSFAAEAALIGYSKTNETRFLNLYIKYFDQVLARRDDKTGSNKYDAYHKRVMKAWGTTELDNVTWVAFVTPNARIVYPATLFSLLVGKNPSLPAKYRAKAEAYLAVAEETLAEFDEDWKKITEDGDTNAAGSGASTVRWMLMPSESSIYPLRREPTNHLHLIGDAWLNLWQLTGKKVYQQKINSVLKSFVNSVQEEADGTVHWNYYPYFAKREKRELALGLRYSENVWKASLTLPFVIRAHRQGFDIPPWLIKAISKTLSQVVVKEKQLLRSLSPKDSAYFTPNDPDVFKAPHIAPLVEWSPSMAKKIVTLMGNRPDLFPDGWFSFFSNRPLMAYARLLS